MKERERESEMTGVRGNTRQWKKVERIEPSFDAKGAEHSRSLRSGQYSRTRSSVKCKFTIHSTDRLLQICTKTNCRCGIQFLLSVKLETFNAPLLLILSCTRDNRSSNSKQEDKLYNYISLHLQLLFRFSSPPLLEIICHSLDNMSFFLGIQLVRFS